MNHRSKKLGFGRLVLAWLMCASAGSAMAQLKDITPPSPAQSLACLTRPAEKLAFPERGKHDFGEGFMRLVLRFEAPNLPPRVEVLVNTAREDMQNLVREQVEKYRLPCWTPADGVVSAVQEFSFNNLDRRPMPSKSIKEDPSLCIVRPDKDPDIGLILPRSMQHLILTMMFDGDATQAPSIKVLYSTASDALVDVARAWASQYRMPCRVAGASPTMLQQQFQFFPGNRNSYVLARTNFSMAEFLRMTDGWQSLGAEFDFTTMQCPFVVNYTMYAPHLPNEATAGEQEDPNRLVFLDWLAKLQIGFSDAKQANDLFGSTLQIQVPCGRLDLKPQPSPNQ